MASSEWQLIEELKRKVGHTDAVYGSRLSRVQSGSGDGTEVLSIWNAAGLRLEVFIGRGFDVFALEYKGHSLHWQGPSGLRSRFAYEPQGWGWLRNFHGGLLMTCGLDHVLFPIERKAPEYDFVPDMQREFGLHGRIANQGGELLERSLVDLDGVPTIRVRGRVLQAALYHERLALDRTIDIPVFGSAIAIHDSVTNIGFNPTHHELLYHFNLGYPLVDAGCSVRVPTAIGHDEIAVDRVAARATEVVTNHQVPTTDVADIEVANEELGLVLRLGYDPRQLPYFFVWNMRAEGVNSIGLEPSSARRADNRSEEARDYLEPGSHADYDLAISIEDL